MDRAWQPAGGGGSLQMLLLSWQLAASSDFSIHQAAVLAHRFCFLIGGGSWHQHIKDLHGINLHCGVSALCHGGVPHSSTQVQTAVRSGLGQACTALTTAATVWKQLLASKQTIPRTAGICSAVHCSNTPGYATDSTYLGAMPVVTHCQKPRRWGNYVTRSMRGVWNKALTC